MLNITLSIDLSNPKVAVFFGQLMKEVGKFDIPVAYGDAPTTKAATPTATAKAVEKKADKPKRAEGDFSTDFDLTLEKDGIHLVLGHHGKGACRAASSKLYGMGLKRNDAYGYYMETKNGKVSAKATKEVFDNLGGKLHIANEDYKRA